MSSYLAHFDRLRSHPSLDAEVARLRAQHHVHISANAGHIDTHDGGNDNAIADDVTTATSTATPVSIAVTNPDDVTTASRTTTPISIAVTNPDGYLANVFSNNNNNINNNININNNGNGNGNGNGNTPIFKSADFPNLDDPLHMATMLAKIEQDLHAIDREISARNQRQRVPRALCARSGGLELRERCGACREGASCQRRGAGKGVWEMGGGAIRGKWLGGAGWAGMTGARGVRFEVHGFWCIV